MQTLTGLLARIALLVFFIASTSLATPALAGDMTLATQNASAPETMSPKELKRLLTGQTTKWPDGTAVIVVLSEEGTPEMAWLCEEILRMPEDVYRRSLLQKVFHGIIPKPVAAADPAQAILDTAGAVGPVSTDHLEGLHAISASK